jgi:hypothetical protein
VLALPYHRIFIAFLLFWAQFRENT